MRQVIRVIVCTALAVVALSGCEDGSFREVGPDKSLDGGFDTKPLTDLQAGIWVDPNGCDHWIIDDGHEGYLSARLNPKTGKPVCSGAAPPTQTVGDFKQGATSRAGDPI